MELQGIGSWFISGKFDIAWSLAALDAALELAGGIGSNHQVVNRLALVAATHSHDAVDCLLRIVKSDHDSRNFFAHDDAAQILKLALAAEDDRARKLAEATISILGERGDASFLRLLQKSGGQGQP